MKLSLQSLIAAVTAALIVAGCGQHEAAKPAATPPRQLDASDIVEASAQPLAQTVPFTGTLKPLNEALVAARVEGTLAEVNVRAGQPVRLGQVLAVIANEALRQTVAEQEAQLTNQEARLKLARVKLDRQRELFTKGFISKLALDELESDFAVQAGSLRVQQAQLKRAREDLSDTVVRAPIAGVVFERAKNPGERIARNEKLFGVADLSELEIAASLPSREGAALSPGMRARFTVEGMPGEFSANVARINPVASTSTRTFEAYLRVSNPDGRLKAGQFARGGVVLHEVDDFVVLPASAVREREKSPWVLVVKNGRLSRAQVKVELESEADRRVAVSGIVPGQTVVTTELIGMKEGDAVKLPLATGK
ncbi:efflux RND transporter periplasmic adaptor subunit [Crenobacter cavernae]|uniref:Efflux RND transporter periplasmic adaptor subunit n=1 Tax=Crenobacter cavernae TaxID=2290923 RepID=A0A345Y6F2_9NEIS|nr:efflux RND transporter periplasmic adaptor subunit [Crenobacter cavernae]AXK39504.1 efflux RND transporter periplasmic adaptor subunit [Crenobacter cavernae]